MQFDPKLSGDAASLARTHAGVLNRLPSTIAAFVLIELQKWPLLFAAERRYQRALLEHLSQPSADTRAAAAGIVRIERLAEVDTIDERDPARFQDLAQAAFRRRSLLPDWRREIDQFFQQTDSALDAQLYPRDAPRRVIVQLYGAGVAIQAHALWSKFKGVGLRLPLQLDRRGADGFLGELFGVAAGGTGSSLFARVRDDRSFTAEDTWLVESHEALHDLAQRGHTSGPAFLTGLSYDRLRGYRDQLMRALYRKIQSGVESPQAFAAFARSVMLAPDPGVLLHPSDVIQSFLRDVLVSGNGTLFVNNTFTEWAAVQALRRAQPRFLVARYGVRDKLKPFSSMLLFSEPRRSDRIPLVEDPLGSFIDVEQLCYYVWLNAGKSPAYRKKTLYLFLAEDADEMLAIRSDAAPPAAAAAGPVRLADVSATIARWLGLPAGESPGRPIAPLDPAGL